MTTTLPKLRQGFSTASDFGTGPRANWATAECGSPALSRRSFFDRQFNLLGQTSQMLGQPSVKGALAEVGGEVPDNGCVGSLGAEFLKSGVQVHHGHRLRFDLPGT